MLSLNSFMIFSADAKKLRDFYKKIFMKEPEMDDGQYYGFVVGKMFIGFGPHDKIKGNNTNPERFIFNLDTEEVKEEFRRIKGLGAKVIAEPYQMKGSDMWIATFADPDGNYFQLTTPWKEEKQK